MAIVVICSMGLVSCATKSSVYVLDQAEVIKIKAGDQVTAKYDGWVFSNRAVDRVMNAKVDDTLNK